MLLGLGLTQAHATTVRPMSIVDLLGHSETILAGKVERVVDGVAPNGVPYTEVTLKVIDPIKGAAGERHTFRQFGLNEPRTLADGRVATGGRPEGWPAWHEGEVALVFLYRKARLTGLQTTVGLGYGKLSLGGGMAMNAYDNAGLFQGVRVNRNLLTSNERSMFEKRKGPANAETLRGFVRRAVAGQWVQKGSIANAKR
jgi:hypothetical protein